MAFAINCPISASPLAEMPGICDAQRENVPTQRSRWFVPEFLSPNFPQLEAGQPAKVLDIDAKISAGFVRPSERTRSVSASIARIFSCTPCHVSDRLAGSTLGFGFFFGGLAGNNSVGAIAVCLL